MKGMCIGISKAKYVDDRGVVFTAVRQGKLWFFEGLMYESPFAAFKTLERSMTWNRQ